VPENIHYTTWVIDIGRWPLVIIRPPSGRGERTDANLELGLGLGIDVDLAADEDRELDQFYQSLEQLLARRRPYVALYDARGVRSSASRRARMSDWSSLNDSAIRTHMIALAVVVGSELERAQVTAGFWSLKQSYHARIFESFEDAERWLLSEFARGEGAN
jgi:hypothetical protein